MTMSADDPRAPTPFTARQIHDGCPRGRTMRILTRAADGEEHLRAVTFVECDELGAERDEQALDAAGQPVGPPRRSSATWEDFRSHASFPARSTVIDEDEADVGGKRLACLRYTVTDGTSVRRFWFARTLPGMPVRVTEHADGRFVSEMVMIEDTVRELG